MTSLHLNNIALAIAPGTYMVGKGMFAESYELIEDVKTYASSLRAIVNTTQCEWLLIWHCEEELPAAQLLQQLSNSKIDVWHAGLKMGLGGMPDMMNYVDPTWMYNKDASDTIEHSSFRLSIKCCMVKVQVLKQFISDAVYYTSVDAAGLALGYRMFKSGCLMRYHPYLKKRSNQHVVLSLNDEWTFARQFYTAKWHTWILLNKQGFIKNLSAYFKTSVVRYVEAKPFIHTSDEVLQATPTNVSVLAPTLKRYPYLVNELKQLSVQTILPHQVLITDQTNLEERELLPFHEYPKLDIGYFPQEEKGQCLAWNKLLSEATGEYVLFLGDDADHITPDFIEKLLATVQHFEADMVASNVIEIGTPQQPINHHYYVSDTFPITLIRKSIVDAAGRMDMFFNKNIRADQDLAMRCHLLGSLMIFNPSATIHHHRAPVGGLRTHKARVVTNFMAKNSITKFVVPTSSELYLVMKYFNEKQFKSFVRIKYFNQLMVNGSVFKKLAKLIVFAVKYPSAKKQYSNNYKAAEQALEKMKSNNKAYESIADN